LLPRVTLAACPVKFSLGRPVFREKPVRPSLAIFLPSSLYLYIFEWELASGFGETLGSAEALRVNKFSAENYVCSPLHFSAERAFFFGEVSSRREGAESKQFFSKKICDFSKEEGERHLSPSLVVF
jgi:hypothetical protein